MKLYSLLFALLALAAPQMGAIEPDQCAELAEQLRDEQAKVKQLEERRNGLFFEKISLEADVRNEREHNKEITKATQYATIASAISGVGFAALNAFEPHMHHICLKSVAAVGGASAFVASGLVSLIPVPKLVSNALDSQRPVAERLGSVCAAAMGIAPAVVYAYIVGPALLAGLSNMPCFMLTAIK